MKYAIFTVCDQTICYITASGAHTTKHPEAVLFDSVQKASQRCVELSVQQALFLKNGGHPEHPVSYTDEQIVERFGHCLEAVEDESEFRAREDTW
ncbi:MAG: hypothetical protein K0U16_07745 [Gammaproteobacteria bacterium]|nr:hypothetical protein [Gammaproteobacteria bacterium]